MLAGSCAGRPGCDVPERERLPPVQGLFSFARPLWNRRRSVRRPFRPSIGEGSYQLPHGIRDRLALALVPFRNRDAAFALAVFLARFWSMPGRVVSSFPIDRRALADRPDLELTEARVRGAIKTLEAIGFLDRAILAPGSTYQATEDGLHRKPVFYVFGSEYGPAFIAANGRAAVACERDRAGRRGDRLSARPCPSTPVLEPSSLKSPKTSSAAESSVIMGEVVTRGGIPPKTFEPDANLEAALERLRRAAGIAGGR
jgi:hypothetical protein